MSQDVVMMSIGIIGLTVTLLLHTGALFYWAGRISTSVRYHEERIKRLEDLLLEKKLEPGG